MPELTPGISRSEARRMKEEKLFSTDWRAGGLLVARGDREASRSRSRSLGKEADRLARSVADAAQQSDAPKKSQIQIAKEMKEREDEKARLKKLAKEEERKKKEEERKESQGQKKPKFKRY
mmetsp:Transcript_5946/g.9669  ORF Transcript_5946/g.9669 Transcript_5946/m.9669 type:complete len:121 (+) Transcript_5946:76-438(+)